MRYCLCKNNLGKEPRSRELQRQDGLLVVKIFCLSVIKQSSALEYYFSEKLAHGTKINPVAFPGAQSPIGTETIESSTHRSTRDQPRLATCCLAAAMLHNTLEMLVDSCV